VQLALEATGVPPPRVMAATVTENLFERNEPIAGVADRVLQGDQLGRVLVEPLERVPHPPDRAPETMQGGKVVVRRAREPVPAIERLSQEALERVHGTIAWHRPHRSQCESHAGAALGLERAHQLAPRLLPSFVQIGCPPRRWAVRELHVVVSSGAGDVAQPAQVVLQDPPRSQREPYAQACDRHAKLVHVFNVAGRAHGLQMARQVRQPGLRGDHQWVPCCSLGLLPCLLNG
jgi:hypothetical protein